MAHLSPKHHPAGATKSHGATPPKPLHCIDLFSGCGGLSLGLEQAGFTPLLFSEINGSAAETYIANRADMSIVPVGDVYNLTDTDLKLLQTYWRYHDIPSIDLVCGGPPCQGFSGIGHRRTFKLDKKEIPSNHLFEEMVRVIRVVQPKLFLFENVRGLLNARWDASGTSGEIFTAVLKAFAELKNYRIKWDLIHAKDYGVPQNRPRVLMVGIREDVVPSWVVDPHLEPSACTPSAVSCKFLPQPVGGAPDLQDLLSDLEDPDYLDKSQTTTYLHEPKSPIQRFLRTSRAGSILQKGASLSEQEYATHADYVRAKFQHMIANNGEIAPEHRTKKFAQRVFPRTWPTGGPNLTATSLPDDFVHYSQPRIPTVREWARIQTFPDWYCFTGPRTTGGRRRAGDPGLGLWDRDVPKFTQIGNAVPPLLAFAVGTHLAKLLKPL